MAGSGALLVRKERFAALTSVANEEQTMLAITECLAGGEGFEPMSLMQICAKHDWPYLRLLHWLASSDVRWRAYEQVLKFRADEYVAECVPIADGATPKTVVVARNRIEARLKVAARWDRERFGELANAVVQPPVTINIGVRRETGETAGQQAGRVIEHAQEHAEGGTGL